MRRIVILILCLALLISPVFAADQIRSAQSFNTVSADGSCDVTLSLTLHLDGPVEDLVFPIPADASGISLNGRKVHPSQSDHAKKISLSSVVGSAAGDYPISIQYSLPNLVTPDSDGRLFLELPLLSGFAYPVSDLEFTVTLPADVTERPSFSSGYHKESIESSIIFTTKGAVLSGRFLQPLKDHETLSMQLEVSAEQFTGIHIKSDGVSFATIAAIILLVLALVYWLIFLRCLPSLPLRWPTCPEGLTAGDLSTHLTAVARDFPMMVVTWAQLGYLLIQTDDNGRVLLHKRMDMGNERSDGENRLFRQLFGKRRMVDGTGYHFALVWQKAAKTPAGLRQRYSSRSGNPLLFRLLACAAGLCFGITIGSSLPDSTFWSIILGLILGILAAVSSWMIQTGCHYLHLRHKNACRWGLALCCAWLLFGLISKTAAFALALILTQLAAGFAAAYGGRRSSLGRQELQQILGLRRYLRRLKAKELYALLRTNPDYFYQLAPCAMALGVDKALKRHCGKVPLPACGFLIGSIGGRTTVSEWLSLLQDTAEAMDERYMQQSRLDQNRSSIR